MVHANRFRDVATAATWVIDKASDHVLEVMLVAAGTALLVLVRRWWKRRNVNRAADDRLAILVAAFEGDEAHRPRQREVCDAIAEKFGEGIYVTTWPDALPVPVGRDLDVDRAVNAIARRWLRRTNCDALIWGYAKGPRAISLRFTWSNARKSLRSYVLGDALELGPAFGDDLVAELMPHLFGIERLLRADDKLFVERGLKKSVSRIERLLQGDIPPDIRATLQCQLGLALHRLGAQFDTGDLDRAVEAYRAALKYWGRYTHPQQRADTLNQLGWTLKLLGERRNSEADLRAAIEALEEAGSICADDDRTDAANNLACTRSTLGTLLGDAAMLERAIADFATVRVDYLAASREFDAVKASDNMGTAQLALGKLRKSENDIAAAVETHKAALDAQYRTWHTLPLPRAITQGNLANALLELAEYRTGTEELERAIGYYSEAVYTVSSPQNWDNLARARHILADRRKATRQAAAD